MKQPKLKDLVIDRAGTRKLRSQLDKTKRIKISINFDERSLTFLRKVSGRSALPYQQILSHVLKETTGDTGAAKSRLDRIERELKKLKRRIAA